MTNASRTPVTSQPQLVDDFFLEAQDDYYAKRRLPEPTPAGAEGRTYCFRVEFQGDLFPLRAMLEWAIEKWWSSPLCPMGDADAKVTLKPGALNREELRWLFSRVVDCHVAVETVELEADYTGERRFLDAEELGAKVPGATALEQSLAGMGNYRKAIASVARRAKDAQEEIAQALATMRDSPSARRQLNSRRNRASS